MAKYFCKEHEGWAKRPSPGGTYCWFHNREICMVKERHCKVCGIKISEENIV